MIKLKDDKMFNNVFCDTLNSIGFTYYKGAFTRVSEDRDAVFYVAYLHDNRTHEFEIIVGFYPLFISLDIGEASFFELSNFRLKTIYNVKNNVSIRSLGTPYFKYANEDEKAECFKIAKEFFDEHILNFLKESTLKGCIYGAINVANIISDKTPYGFESYYDMINRFYGCLVIGDNTEAMNYLKRLLAIDEKLLNDRKAFQGRFSDADLEPLEKSVEHWNNYIMRLENRDISEFIEFANENKLKNQAKIKKSKFFI